MATWAQYLGNRIDNFGVYPDPEGAFPKPDSNIITPDGTSITALGTGMVSGIDEPGSGVQVPYGHVVTVLLFTPHNDLATHDVYLHLASVSVKLGQIVKEGDEIGTSGSQSPEGNASGASTGFAFYPGDWYGRDEAWTRYYQGQTTLDGRLNPVPFLDSLVKRGPKGIPESTTGGSLLPDFSGLNTFFGNINSLFSNPMRILKIVLGTVIFVAGVVLAIQQLKPVQTLEQTGIKAAIAA